jgi:hypothetical protein
LTNEWLLEIRFTVWTQTFTLELAWSAYRHAPPTYIVNI